MTGRFIAMFIFWLCCVSSLPSFANATMSQEEYRILSERILEADQRNVINACNEIGDSNAKGIKSTREGCRIYHSKEEGFKQESFKHFINASTAGEPYAKYYLAKYFKQPKSDEATQLFTEAATQGVVEAQISLAQILLKKQELAQAEQWLEKAASGGDIRGEAALGLFYVLSSILKEYNEKEDIGCRLVLSTAKRGYFGSQRLIVLSHDSYSSFKKEMPWFLNQATNGNVDQYLMAGMMYEYGAGVDKDLAEARSWYEKAVREMKWNGVVRLHSLAPPE